MSQKQGASPTLDKTFIPAEVEARHAKRWEESGAFGCGRGAGAPYSIVIPPPNVTGSLHMGHALNNTLQDVLVRWRRMQGRDVLWQPGTDHAGIATQMVVERQLDAQGIGLDRGGPATGNRRLISRDEFVRRVWQWKAESGDTISRQLRRLGASLDWARERFTMDEGLSAAVQKVFVELYRRGLIYRDNRLVNWDPKLHTAISDLEVEQREIKGHLWHFKYPIEETPGEFIVVATTRPETMLGDTGVAVHPNDARYQRFVGMHCILPLVGRRIPIVADEYSDPEKGTGAVKITPAHDFNDFEVARRHKLEMVNIFTADASLNGQVPAAFRGLDRFEARKRVVAAMESDGLLDKIEAHTHVVPHGDRSGVPIEPWLTMQWYVDAVALAKPAIDAVEQGRTVFVPKNWEKTYFEWMRNIQPWSISRQLWWGHQIPAWYGPDGKVFVAMDEAAARAAARAHYAKDVALERDPDVLDTWFSSALWPFSTLGWPEATPELARYYPTSVLVTGFDIIFFWVARMMMMGLHFMGEVPFRTVYIHALVRDAKGQKMSKSKGNIIDPLDLIERYGCDALRFTLTALAAQGRDIKLAESRVEGYRNFATKLWNAARYCQMNQSLPRQGFDPRGAKLTVNRWIVGELARAAADADAALEAYRFNDAANALYRFTWGTFCDWYLEFTKPVLSGADEAAKTETRAITGFVLDVLLRLLHPVMPFITEELWEKLALGRGGLLIVAPWPELPADLVDPAAKAEMDWVVEAISEIRGLRSEMNVPAAARLTIAIKEASPSVHARLRSHREIISTLARLERIDERSVAGVHGAIQLVLPEATLVLPLAGVIDPAAEAARLSKEIDKLADEIGKIDRKLENPAFLAKADPAVVEDQRERRSEAVAARGRLAIALERVQAI
ncbi:MAG TPA: valine--tRNA ligase [Alphaproteobacteria bacterium]|nr:valine--tRNA ligase [Alphaproteobacteria bacterium]